MQRAAYDLPRIGLRVAIQLWPLWLFWGAWDFAYDRWQDYLMTFPANQPGGYLTDGYTWALRAWPSVALLGPFVVMVAGVALSRTGIGSRAMAFAGAAGMAATGLLTGWSEYQRLRPYVGDPRYSILDLVHAFDPPHGVAVIFGLFAAFAGFCGAIRARPIGRRSAPSLLRGTSDNFGHAAWLSAMLRRTLSMAASSSARPSGSISGIAPLSWTPMMLSRRCPAMPKTRVP